MLHKAVMLVVLGNISRPPSGSGSIHCRRSFLLLFACSVNKKDAAHVALHLDLDHISEFKEKRANVIS